jgi:hypothetical protein
MITTSTVFGWLIPTSDGVQHQTSCQVVVNMYLPDTEDELIV